MLMRNERLARLKARFDPATHVLAIELEGATVAGGKHKNPSLPAATLQCRRFQRSLRERARSGKRLASV